jgi:hypothetical protein
LHLKNLHSTFAPAIQTLIKQKTIPMRKLSFLSLGIMLLLSSCTKEDNFSDYNPGTPVDYNEPAPYSVAYSSWTADANFTWSDGAATEPTRETTMDVPELTEEALNAGGFVLLYAQSKTDGAVQVVPAAFGSLNNEEVNNYSASYIAGQISLAHTRLVNGNPEVPNDANDISFRYIVIIPNTPDPNGRPITVDDLRGMPYQGLISVLGIPE